MSAKRVTTDGLIIDFVELDIIIQRLKLMHILLTTWVSSIFLNYQTKRHSLFRSMRSIYVLYVQSVLQQEQKLLLRKRYFLW